MSTEFRWTDCDGSEVLVTTDRETCGDEDAVAVVAFLHEVEGGAYLTPSQARGLIVFLEGALNASG